MVLRCRQGGEFNVEYANTFPELAKLNLSTSNVLDHVTVDKYNFATVSSCPPPPPRDPSPFQLPW